MPDPDENRVLLHGISWDTYSAILRDIGDGAPRLTYNNGLLEIELPGRLHEQMKKLASTIVEAAMNHLGIAFEPSGETTWRKQLDAKGLEADDSYHIQNIERVLGKSELDLTTDPPPDLAIEIEVASPLMDKMEVYRGLKVPELWQIRADGGCSMFLLDAAGIYQPIASSTSVPVFTPAIISQYMLLREQTSHNQTVRRFEAEVLGAKG
jgi:Uma2 family endonuclease